MKTCFYHFPQFNWHLIHPILPMELGAKHLGVFISLSWHTQLHLHCKCWQEKVTQNPWKQNSNESKGRLSSPKHMKFWKSFGIFCTVKYRLDIKKKLQHIFLITTLPGSFILHLPTFHLLGFCWDDHSRPQNRWDGSQLSPSQTPANHPSRFFWLNSISIPKWNCLHN